MKKLMAAVKSLCLVVVAFLTVTVLANFAVVAFNSFFSPVTSSTIEYAFTKPEAIQPLYPDLNASELKHKLALNSGQGIRYRGYVETQNEPGFTGRYLVHDEGFRIDPNQNATWPPTDDALTIFVFGGDAILGPTIDDIATVPSALREMIIQHTNNLPVHVFNFATYGHLSTQQRLFFETLLINGHIPDVALFYGITEDLVLVEGEPYFNDLVKKHFHDQALLWKQLPITYLALEAFEKLPLVQLIKGGFSSSNPSVTDVSLLPSKDMGHSDIEKVVERYVENTKSVKAVADKFGVISAFIIIPLPESANAALRDEISTQLNSHNILKTNAWIDCTDSRAFFDQKNIDNYSDEGHLIARAALEIALCTYENLIKVYPDFSAMNQ